MTEHLEQITIDWILDAENCLEYGTEKMTDKTINTATPTIGYTIKHHPVKNEPEYVTALKRNFPANAYIQREILKKDDYQKNSALSPKEVELENLELEHLSDTLEYEKFERKKHHGTLDDQGEVLMDKLGKKIANMKIQIANLKGEIAASKKSSQSGGQDAYNPVLSFVGMQQASQLAMFVEKQEPPYQYALVAATIPSIMTAMIAFQNTNTNILVAPFLASPFTQTMTVLPSESLEKKMEFVSKWLQDNWISEFDDIRVMQSLQSIKTALITTKLQNLATNVEKYWSRVNILIHEYIDKILLSRIQAAKKGKLSNIISQPYDFSVKDVIINILKRLGLIMTMNRNFNINNLPDNYDSLKPNPESAATYQEYYQTVVLKRFHDAISYLKNAVRNPNAVDNWKSWPEIDYSLLKQIENIAAKNKKINTTSVNKEYFYDNILTAVIKKIAKTHYETASRIYQPDPMPKIKPKSVSQPAPETLPYQEPDALDYLREETRNENQYIKDIKLCCITSIKSINEILNLSQDNHQLRHTQIIRENFTQSLTAAQQVNILNNVFAREFNPEYYVPNMIRDYYNNFRKLNLNVCDSKLGIDSIINVDSTQRKNAFQEKLKSCLANTKNCDRSIQRTLRGQNKTATNKS